MGHYKQPPPSGRSTLKYQTKSSPEGRSAVGGVDLAEESFEGGKDSWNDIRHFRPIRTDQR